MATHAIETFRAGHVCIVRVRDRDGAEGWGQTAPYNADITEDCLHRMVAPWALGREADDVEAVVRLALDRNYKFTGSFLYRAVGGIDTALWDLRAKRAGKTVCELFGGTPGPQPCYASSMRRDNTPEQETARMVDLVNRCGFRAVKIKIGPRLGRDDDAAGAEIRTRALVPMIRKALPANVQIFADANGSYAPDRAIEVGHWLADHGISQYEEPCPHTDITGTAKVTAALTGIITVTGGEQDYLPAIWDLMTSLPAVHVIQPDVMYNGGICTTLAVAKLAAQRGIKVLPHAANHSMLQVFTQHLLRALPNADAFMEYSIEDTDWTKDLYTPAPQIINGAMPFSPAAGWGITPDPQWLETATRRETLA